MKSVRPASLLGKSFLAFFRFAPGRIVLVFSLMLLQGLTAGMGLLLVLPLLHVLGLEAGPGPESALTGRLVSALSRAGFPLRLEILLACYVLIIAAVATLDYATTVMAARLQQGYVCRLRNTLYRDLLRSRWQFIMRRRMSDFMHGLGSQVQSMGAAAQQILSLSARLVPLAAMAALAFLLSWRMTSLVAALAGLLVAVQLPLNRRAYRTGRSQLEDARTIFQMLTEQLASLKMIKSHGGESRYARQLEGAGEALESKVVLFARMSALTQWIHLVGAVSCFALFLYASIEVFAVPMADLVLLTFIFSRILPQVSALQKSYQQLLGQLPAFEEVESMSRACREAEESRAVRSDAPPRLADRIVLDNVSYRYPDGGRDILSRFSATIRRNHTVSLVGPSGAGKSTLADLIAGLLEPSEGRILCDGVELSGDHRIAWRSSLAYVTQEVFLFNDTVRANLAWMADGASDQALWEALRLAAADDFVARLPDGLDTVIGDRGVRLSGGERQRLALARAMLTHPQLLILDEATSALDAGNEERIHQALQRLRGKLTVVIIAHREATVRHADECIRLEKASAF